MLRPVARRTLRALGILGVAFFAATGAFAQKPKAVVATAPPGDKQQALSVGFDAAGALRAKVCAAAPCAIDGGTDLGLPEPAKAVADTAKLSVMSVGKGRRVVTVEIADKSR